MISFVNACPLLVMHASVYTTESHAREGGYKVLYEKLIKSNWFK